MKPVLVLAGPTCVGKTSVALQLARRLGNAALINADSRQLFLGLHVGTAAPTVDELDGVRAELFGVVAPGQDVSLATWLGSARDMVSRLSIEELQPIMVGGTGLFITAFSDGYELIPASVDAKRRDQLNLQAATDTGLEAMRAELTSRSPKTAATIDMANPRRVIRALELVEAGVAEPVSRVNNPPRSLVVCVDAERTLHRQLIEKRAEKMFANDALVREIQQALKGGITPENLRKCGIGYPEGLDITEGKITSAQGLQSVVNRTIRYAKVQRTWFRHHRVDHNIIRSQESTEDLSEEILRLWQDFSN